MKKASISISASICILVLFGLAGNGSATSPQPEEVRPGQTSAVCTTHVVYTPDREKGTRKEEALSTFVFEASGSKGEVVEKIARHISDRLNEGHISEFTIECKFPKQ